MLENFNIKAKPFLIKKLQKNEIVIYIIFEHGITQSLTKSNKINVLLIKKTLDNSNCTI